MSVQLEILPQNYQGFSTDFTPPPLEMITDGQLFGINYPGTTNPLVNNGLTGVHYSDVGAGTTWNSNFSLNWLNNVSNYMTFTYFYSLNPGSWASYRVDPNGQGGTGLIVLNNALNTNPYLQFKGNNTSADNIPNRFGVAYKFGYSLTPGTNYTYKIKIYGSNKGADENVYRIKAFHVPYSATVAGYGPFPNGFPFVGAGSSKFIDTVQSTVSAGDVLEGTFTAQNDTDVIWIEMALYYQDVIEIESISCIETGTEQAEILVGNGSVIADLYEDEDIPLTLSVDEFKNVAEKVQSYSKAFKLPSTKRNSQIFDNIFEITRTANGTNSFNPYIKTQCRLKEDGFVLFEGYLRMIDIIDKEGEISYNVNLYSEAVALADTLAEKTFNDLDFSELEHAYDFTQIKKSFDDNIGVDYLSPATSIFRNALTIKYPFCSWNHQFSAYVDTSGTNPANANFPVLENLQTAFRPFVNVKYLVNKIFDSSPFEYTSDFFSTPDFEKLYMDFNWGSDAAPLTNENTGTAIYQTMTAANGDFPSNIIAGDTENYATTSYTNFKFPNNNFPAAFGWDSTTNKFTIPAGLTNVNLIINTAARFVAKKDCNVTFRWIYNEGTATESISEETVNWGAGPISGAAVAFPILQGTQTGTTHPITGIFLHEGGDYSSAPTVTTDPSGNPAPNPTNITATLTGSEVTGMTINDSAVYFSFNNLDLKFNNKNNFGEFYRGFPLIGINAGDTVALQWKADVSNAVRQRDTGIQDHQFKSMSDMNSTLDATITYTGTVNNAVLQTLRGETEQWGFLKGLINMFNLITVPDKENPSNITIEPYNDIFIDNTDIVEHDWTDKVDVSQIKLTPLTDLNQKTLFKFVEDDDDFPFNNYKKQVSGFLYGSLLFDASGFTILGGETEEIEAEPFAATVCKPMMSQFPELIVPTIYAQNDEGTFEGFDNSPRILFNNGVKTLSQTEYLVPAQASVATEEWMSTFLQFSHLSDIQTIVNNPSQLGDTRDFHFGPCPLIGLGNSPVDTLYSNYWQPYFGELYNADTRIMSIKVNLSAADINTFNMFDKVFIKNRTFRVNKIDYKPGDLSTVEFILIP